MARDTLHRDAMGVGLRRVMTAAALALLALTACADAGSSQVSRPEACDEFNKITADFKMTDQQSATAYRSLAERTEDPALAAAIQRVASGFARSDPAISSSEVLTLCR